LMKLGRMPAQEPKKERPRKEKPKKEKPKEDRSLLKKIGDKVREKIRKKEKLTTEDLIAFQEAEK
ncbi:unnamed protein product, partial [marine sediment metagenome]